MMRFLAFTILIVPAFGQGLLDQDQEALLSAAFHRGDAPAKVGQWFKDNTGPNNLFTDAPTSRAAARSFYRALVPRPSSTTTSKVNDTLSRSVRRLHDIPPETIMGKLGGVDVTALQIETMLSAQRAANEQIIADHDAADQVITDAETALSDAQTELAADPKNTTSIQVVADAQSALDAARAAKAALPSLER